MLGKAPAATLKGTFERCDRRYITFGVNMRDEDHQATP